MTSPAAANGIQMGWEEFNINIAATVQTGYVRVSNAITMFVYTKTTNADVVL